MELGTYETSPRDPLGLQIKRSEPVAIEKNYLALGTPNKANDRGHLCRPFFND
jgi:hypothetical protein